LWWKIITHTRYGVRMALSRKRRAKTEIFVTPLGRTIFPRIKQRSFSHAASCPDRFFPGMDGGREFRDRDAFAWHRSPVSSRSLRGKRRRPGMGRIAPVGRGPVGNRASHRDHAEAQPPCPGRPVEFFYSNFRQKGGKPSGKGKFVLNLGRQWLICIQSTILIMGSITGSGIDPASHFP